jgi:hypothetical protein
MAGNNRGDPLRFYESGGRRSGGRGVNALEVCDEPGRKIDEGLNDFFSDLGA